MANSFIKGKRKMKEKKITDNNSFNVFSDDASLLSGVISSAYKEAEIREEVRKETAKDILKSLKFLYAERQKEYTNWDGNKINAVTTKWLNADIECIAKEYGIELFGKTEQVENFDKLEDEV